MNRRVTPAYLPDGAPVKSFLRAIDQLAARAARVRAQFNEVAASGFAADNGYLDTGALGDQELEGAALEASRAEFNLAVTAVASASPAARALATEAWRASLSAIVSAGA
jgi:hypothetical protein